MTEEVKQDRDPVLDEQVTLTFTVEQLNVILALLSELPYGKVNSVVPALRDTAINQIRERKAKEAEAAKAAAEAANADAAGAVQTTEETAKKTADATSSMSVGATVTRG